MNKNLKCFVVDGVTFIGILEMGKASEVAAITMSDDGIMGIGAISPYLDLATEPEIYLDRALGIFTPAAEVLTVYKAYRKKLEAVRAQEPTLALVEDQEPVDPTEEANDPA